MAGAFISGAAVVIILLAIARQARFITLEINKDRDVK